MQGTVNACNKLGCTYPEFDEYSEKRLAECIDFVNSQRPDMEKHFLGQFIHPAWEMGELKVRCRITHDFAPLSFYFEKLVWYQKKSISFQSPTN
jgi:hypothetical protein